MKKKNKKPPPPPNIYDAIKALEIVQDHMDQEIFDAYHLAKKTKEDLKTLRDELDGWKSDLMGVQKSCNTQDNLTWIIVIWLIVLSFLLIRG